MPLTQRLIDATFEDVNTGYRFNIRYKSKRAFLASLSRSKKGKFIHAVDHIDVCVIYPHTLGEYRNA